MMRTSEAPIARAASTYSRSRRERKLARTTRATEVHNNTTRIAPISLRPRPRSVENAASRTRRAGKLMTVATTLASAPAAKITTRTRRAATPRRCRRKRRIACRHGPTDRTSGSAGASRSAVSAAPVTGGESYGPAPTIDAMQTSGELRAGFRAFFESKGHQFRSSASLIPRADDRSTLLTSAGMQPLMPFFLGREQPPAPLLTTVQKVFRTPDIDDVGLDTFHLTFFEMLGNFSFGQYFKEGAVELAWEFVQERLGFDWDRI